VLPAWTLSTPALDHVESCVEFSGETWPARAHASEAAEALKGRASEVEVSLHAAALAVLATSPTDVLLIDEPSS
jgi:hypothetical protein